MPKLCELTPFDAKHDAKHHSLILPTCMQDLAFLVKTYISLPEVNLDRPVLFFPEHNSIMFPQSVSDVWVFFSMTLHK